MCNDKYQPISCSEYDRYEIAIMRNQLLLLEWLDNSGVKYHQKVKPVDLKIINGSECLIAELETVNEVLIVEIRLDKILQVK